MTYEIALPAVALGLGFFFLIIYAMSDEGADN